MSIKPDFTTEKERHFDSLDKSSHEFMNTWKRVEGNDVVEEVTPDDRSNLAQKLETADILNIVFTFSSLALFATLMFFTFGG